MYHKLLSSLAFCSQRYCISIPINGTAGPKVNAFNVVVDIPTLPSKEAAPIYAPSNGASLGSCSNSQLLPITWQPGPSELWGFDLRFFTFAKGEQTWTCLLRLTFVCELCHYPLLLLPTGLLFPDWFPSSCLRAGPSVTWGLSGRFFMLAGAGDLCQGLQPRAGCFQSITVEKGSE